MMDAAEIMKAFSPHRGNAIVVPGRSGRHWVQISDKPNRAPQSRLVRFDPAKGQITHENGAFLFERLDAIAADGPVADDKTPPNATLRGQSTRSVQSRALCGGSANGY